MRLYPRPASSGLYLSAVQEKRAQLGMSLAQLAALCGKTTKTIGRIENRQRNAQGRPLGFRPDTAALVAKALGEPVDALFADRPTLSESLPGQP